MGATVLAAGNQEQIVGLLKRLAWQYLIMVFAAKETRRAADGGLIAWATQKLQNHDHVVSHKTFAPTRTLGALHSELNFTPILTCHTRTHAHACTYRLYNGEVVLALIELATGAHALQSTVRLAPARGSAIRSVHAHLALDRAGLSPHRATARSTPRPKREPSPRASRPPRRSSTFPRSSTPGSTHLLAHLLALYRIFFWGSQRQRFQRFRLPVDRPHLAPGLSGPSAPRPRRQNRLRRYAIALFC
jgi:hypothetical protein